MPLNWIVLLAAKPPVSAGHLDFPCWLEIPNRQWRLICLVKIFVCRTDFQIKFEASFWRTEWKVLRSTRTSRFDLCSLSGWRANHWPGGLNQAVARREVHLLKVAGVHHSGSWGGIMKRVNSAVRHHRSGRQPALWLAPVVKSMQLTNVYVLSCGSLKSDYNYSFCRRYFCSFWQFQVSGTIMFAQRTVPCHLDLSLKR